MGGCWISNILATSPSTSPTTPHPNVGGVGNVQHPTREARKKQERREKREEERREKREERRERGVLSRCWTDAGRRRGTTPEVGRGVRMHTTPFLMPQGLCSRGVGPVPISLTFHIVTYFIYNYIIT